jgi:hypothetical protein
VRAEREGVCVRAACLRVVVVLWWWRLRSRQLMQSCSAQCGAAMGGEEGGQVCACVRMHVRAMRLRASVCVCTVSHRLTRNPLDQTRNSPIYPPLTVVCNDPSLSLSLSIA